MIFLNIIPRRRPVFVCQPKFRINIFYSTSSHCETYLFLKPHLDSKYSFTMETHGTSAQQHLSRSLSCKVIALDRKKVFFFGSTSLSPCSTSPISDTWSFFGISLSNFIYKMLTCILPNKLKLALCYPTSIF